MLTTTAHAPILLFMRLEYVNNYLPPTSVIDRMHKVGHANANFPLISDKGSSKYCAINLKQVYWLSKAASVRSFTATQFDLPWGR